MEENLRATNGLSLIPVHYDESDKRLLKLFLGSAQAGFPSPASDYVERELDLLEHLIPHPLATFLVRGAGDSMEQAGIRSGDILIVDRSLPPSNGKIVLAAIEGEFTVKRLVHDAGKKYLMPENDNYPAFPVTAETEIIGVVTFSIHRL